MDETYAKLVNFSKTGTVVRKRKLNKTNTPKNPHDYFNLPLTREECVTLAPFVTMPASAEQIQSWLQCDEVIPFVSNSTHVVMNFISCLVFCSEWLESQLKMIGWSENKTGYKPFSICHSVDDLLQETMSNFRIACKQMLRFLESHECHTL